VNLATIIDKHPDDAVAVISRGRQTTFGELRRQVGALRGGLAGLGVQPGDRVAIVGANNWFFVVSYFAALGVGAVVVPLNPGSPPAELERELVSTDARVAVVAPSGRESFLGIDRSALPLEHVLVPEGVDLPGGTSLEELFSAEPVPVVEREAGDLALLVFTAGTAGAPKAAQLTHGNLLSNLEQAHAVKDLRMVDGDVVLAVAPPFHILGLNAVLGLAFYVGAALVLVERFDPVSTLALIREHAVTVVPAAPPVFVAWTALPAAPDDAFATVRLALSGGAPLATEVASAFRDRFGVTIWNGYGLTEASPIVTTALVGGEARPGSIGRPIPGVEVRLVDSEGEDALAGDSGEIWVRGANVFPGYWQNDAATAAALTDDGWLMTGDIAVADDDGALYLVDRSKDLIIVSGFNVYPAEVEEVLLLHPAIAEAAVVGVEHPYSGEAVKAFVVAERGRHLEEDEVIEFCAQHLARYKCPSSVMFVDSLPHGLVGKLLRRELR
jgi:long-chain acyl-CoA synthetase